MLDFYFLTRVALKRSRWGEFAEFVADHIFGDEDLIEDLSVVNHECKTDEFRHDSTSSGPGFDRLARTGGNLPVYLGKELVVYIRSFFQRSSHTAISHRKA